VHYFKILHSMCQRIFKPKCVFAEEKVKRGGHENVEIKHRQTLFAGPRCLFKFPCYKKTVLIPAVQCSRLENERDRVQTRALCWVSVALKNVSQLCIANSLLQFLVLQAMRKCKT